MNRVIPLFPDYFTAQQAAEYMARTDEFTLRRIARWEAQMDIEFPKLACPDLGVVPLGKPPTRTPPT